MNAGKGTVGTWLDGARQQWGKVKNFFGFGEDWHGVSVTLVAALAGALVAGAAARVGLQVLSDDRWGPLGVAGALGAVGAAVRAALAPWGLRTAVQALVLRVGLGLVLGALVIWARAGWLRGFGALFGPPGNVVIEWLPLVLVLVVVLGLGRWRSIGWGVGGVFLVAALWALGRRWLGIHSPDPHSVLASFSVGILFFSTLALGTPKMARIELEPEPFFSYWRKKGEVWEKAEDVPHLTLQYGAELTFSGDADVVKQGGFFWRKLGANSFILRQQEEGNFGRYAVRLEKGACAVALTNGALVPLESSDLHFLQDGDAVVVETPEGTLKARLRLEPLSPSRKK